MKKCKYCDNAPGEYCHEECWQEYIHRRRNDLCTRCCGQVVPNTAWCGSCDKQSDFKKYPGGST